ncbi:MAG: polysaccharide pyruvyl transferase, partial [Sulfurifustis sp.]
LVMPPLHLVNEGRLLAHIDRNWDARDALKEQIARKLPALRTRAAETNELALDLLLARQGDVELRASRSPIDARP